LSQIDPHAAPMPNAEPLPSALERAGALERASDRDRHINLGFEAYRPVRPLDDKVRAENLLWHSLLYAGVLEQWDDPLHAIQRHIGRDRSVWGVFFDLDRGALSWELRLLNTEARSPLGVLDGLRATLTPWIELAPGLTEAPPYAVLGLRFDTQTMARGKLEIVELHERSPGTHELEVYRTSATERVLISRDVVLEPKRHIDEVLPLIKRSEFLDFAADKRLLGRVLIPELFACRRLHISKREHCDALCFSGVNIEQLVFAYKRFDLPAALLGFLTAHQARLEHLLFDVAIEYRAHADQVGKIEYLRVGFYGSF
jgi:hypothetical protein